MKGRDTTQIHQTIYSRNKPMLIDWGRERQAVHHAHNVLSILHLFRTRYTNIRQHKIKSPNSHRLFLRNRFTCKSGDSRVHYYYVKNNYICSFIPFCSLLHKFSQVIITSLCRKPTTAFALHPCYTFSFLISSCKLECESYVYKFSALLYIGSLRYLGEHEIPASKSNSFKFNKSRLHYYSSWII